MTEEDTDKLQGLLTKVTGNRKLKTEYCNNGDKCWCRLVVPSEPASKDDYIFPDGSISIPQARFFVHACHSVPALLAIYAGKAKYTSTLDQVDTFALRDELTEVTKGRRKLKIVPCFSGETCWCREVVFANAKDDDQPIFSAIQINKQQAELFVMLCDYLPELLKAYDERQV